jgi:hypothetical protein
MYNSGATISQLCKEFNRCTSTVRDKIKEYGLPPRRLPLTVDIEKFRCAYYSGISSYQLAKNFRICRSSVARIVKELGLREEMMKAVHEMDEIANPLECYARI